MSQSTVLREATDADIPALLTVVRDAFAEYRDRLDPPSGAHKETAESLRTNLQTGSAVAACVDNAIVGCVFYSPRDKYLYVGRLSVLPAFRRSGIGKALMVYAEQRAADFGFQRVQIGVRIALPQLRAYYEGLGYVYVRHQTHPGYSTPTSVVMEKHIGAAHREL